MSIWDLYENIVAQMLTANGNELFYYTFMNEKTRHNYEIDFILARNNKICPIEVKSSGYKTHASLDKFSEKYSGRIAEKYLVAILTALFFEAVRLPCSSSNPLLRSYFSLYGVRHIAELPLVVTCK